MVKIFLRSVKSDIGSGMENCLAMRDSNGHGGINSLVSEVISGSQVIWELEKQSGIKSITRIWSEAATSKVFKHEPKKKLLGNGFQVDLVDSDNELKGKYIIEYILNDNTKMIIDPYIKVLPPA